jgi:hypothetical protein
MISDSDPSRAAIPESLTNLVITQAIAFFCFIIVPTTITLMVPLTHLRMEHSNRVPTVTIRRYLLIFIPWRTEQIPKVTRIRAEITPEYRYRGTSEERRKGQKGVRVATGQFAIVHDGPDVIVQAAPDLAKQIARQYDEFLADKSAGPRTVSVYASWKLSYLLGGVATALSALYLAGVGMAVLSALLKFLRALGK